MILSASRRTDIPCFYSQWFMNRVSAGYALVRNPMNAAQLSRVAITPEVTDCIVFWTKDAQNMLPCLDELDERGFKYYFQFTVTPYGHSLERNLRPKAEIEKTFIELSKRIGALRTVWRYDPIILNAEIDVDYHKRQFARMTDKLKGYTDTVVISFVDMYAKLRSVDIRALAEREIEELAEYMGERARACGIRIVSCAEEYELSRFGVEKSACIDRARIEKVTGRAMRLKKDKNQRPGCGCVESVDIGAYNTCLNGCAYCYANVGLEACARRNAAHDPEGELLVGKVNEGEVTRERAVCSNAAR